MDCGLFTVSEADEDEAGSSRCPSWSAWSTRSSLSEQSALPQTPRSENEDPFEFWDAVCDEPSSGEPSSSADRRPSRPSKRPPAEDLRPYPRPLVAPRSPRTPPSLRQPRVSNCEPSAATRPLLPALPIVSPVLRRSTVAPARAPEPDRIGLGIMAPSGVNLVCALKELLTSCGEYDEFSHDEMFADADEASLLPRSLSAPVVSKSQTVPETPMTQSAYTIPIPRAPRQATAPREHRNAMLFGDHSYLQSLAHEVDDACADAEDVPSLSSSWSSASSRTPSLMTPHLDAPAAPSPPLGSLYSMPNVSLENSLKRVSTRPGTRGTLPSRWRYV